MTTLWWGVRYGGIQYLPIFGQYFRNLNKNGLYLVFQLPNGDGKIQFLIENTTVTVSNLTNISYGDSTLSQYYSNF